MEALIVMFQTLNPDTSEMFYVLCDVIAKTSFFEEQYKQKLYLVQEKKIKLWIFY